MNLYDGERFTCMSDSADDWIAIVGSVPDASTAAACCGAGVRSVAEAAAGAVSAEASSGVRKTEQVSADARARGLVLNWAGISESSGSIGKRCVFSMRAAVRRTAENVNLNAYDSRLRSQLYGLVLN
ncbi:hypothetical protein [Burkholderia pseudomultivorans]|uniref:hypothetical protein n=1 Tax=Burkholderia pseudomultivorans TaxID=1207504 RepID=UPI001E601014|nr:hypothetical protein [Burkholderia pseudomultivorans]